MNKHLSAIKIPGKTRKEVFTAPSTSSLKRSPSGSEYRGKTDENPSMDPSPSKQDFFRNQLALADDLDQGTAV